MISLCLLLLLRLTKLEDACLIRLEIKTLRVEGTREGFINLSQLYWRVVVGENRATCIHRYSRARRRGGEGDRASRGHEKHARYRFVDEIRQFVNTSCWVYRG